MSKHLGTWTRQLMKLERVVQAHVRQLDGHVVGHRIRPPRAIDFDAPALDTSRECDQLADRNTKSSGKMAFVQKPLARLELLDPVGNPEERDLHGWVPLGTDVIAIK